MIATSPLILVPRLWTTLDRLKARIAPRRRRGMLPGTFVGAKIELRKSITLCDGCYWKFGYKRHGYFPVYEMDHKSVTARCQGCGEAGGNRRLYIPEEILRQAWLTTDRKRSLLRHATIVG